MPTVAIECRTGTETMRDSTAKFHVFWSPTAVEAVQFRTERETFLSAATKIRTGLRNTRHIVDNAFPGLRPDFGKWSTSVYDAPEGMVLKIFGSVKGGWNRLINRGALFVLIRQDAAYRKVTMRLTGVDGARYNEAYLQGRFDLLTMEEAQQLGVQVLPQFAHFHAPTQWRNTFQVNLVDAEVRPRPVLTTKILTNDSGEKVTISTPRKRRAIEF